MQEDDRTSDKLKSNRDIAEYKDGHEEAANTEGFHDDAESRRFDSIVRSEVEKTGQKAERVEQPSVEESVVRPVSNPTEITTDRLTEPVRAAGTSSPGVLILQWLTYAFWLWFGAALLVMAGLVLSYFISSNPSSVSEFTTEPLAYSLAAVIVMLLIAGGTDLVYSRFEPLRKAGGATVIMLIHAVVFALLAVGSLVVAVFALVSMLISNSPTGSPDGPTVTLYVALAGLFAYGAMAVRTVFVGRIAHVRKVFWVLILLAAVGFIAASVAGPTSHAVRTRDDRLIESTLPTLQSDIEDYTRKNKKLPETLSNVTSSSYKRDEVQLLIDRGLVRYTPNTKEPTGDLGIRTRSGATIMEDISDLSSGQQDKRHYYSLCVTYREAKGQPKNYEEPSVKDSGNGLGSMDSSVYLYSEVMEHPKGDHCYELTAVSYGSSRTIYD